MALSYLSRGGGKPWQAPVLSAQGAIYGVCVGGGGCGEGGGGGYGSYRAV